MREFHVLNLGGGVQSTTIYLMVAKGWLDLPITHAIFADTQEEPEAVYPHLEWLKQQNGPEIVVRTRGKLGDDLIRGNATGGRFASIPAYTAAKEGETLGITRRQCTREYKIDVIERTIRRELIGLKPRERIPKDVHVHQYFGFSFDEAGRAARSKQRFATLPWADVHFPLFDDQMKRCDCVKWLEEHGNVPHRVPRTACVFCPFRSNREWREIKQNPADWARAVQVDEAMRQQHAICKRGLNQDLYVHRSSVPLEKANLDERQQSLFDMECEGGCGL